MKNNELATNNQQQPGRVSSLLTPEMRRQICELKRGLEQCSHPLFNHLGSLNTIFEALNTAQQSAECLLRDEPFEVWEKLIQDDGWDEPCDTTERQEARTTAGPNVKRMITQPMRQQLVQALRRLVEYRGCLTEFVNDLTKLKSFDTALRLAEDLQCNRPLETAKAREEREEAEAREYFELFEAPEQQKII